MSDRDARPVAVPVPVAEVQVHLANGWTFNLELSNGAGDGAHILMTPPASDNERDAA